MSFQVGAMTAHAAMGRLLENHSPPPQHYRASAERQNAHRRP
jgi:hypothetical protein